MLQQGKNNCDRYPQSAYAKLSSAFEIIWLVVPPFPLVDLADEAGSTPLATVFQPAWLPAHPMGVKPNNGQGVKSPVCSL